MKRFQMLAALFFALSLSAWLGRAELHTDDTGILVGLIGMGAFLLSMIEPSHPWMWGLIVPAGVISVELWRRTGAFGDLIGIAAFTIAIASAGAYIGAFLRRHISLAG